MAALTSSGSTSSTAYAVTAPGTATARPRRLLALAAAAGVVLGWGDLQLQLHLPYPWASLADSSAIWAVAALVVTFAATRRFATGAVAGAIAGAVMLVVAVEAYYVAAILADRSGTATLWAPTAVLWLELALLSGAAFGGAGAVTRSGRSWQVVGGTGLALGVMLGQAAAWWPEPAFGHTPALATAGLGLVLVAAVGAVTGRPGAALAGCLAALPVAAILAAAFTAGIGR